MSFATMAEILSEKSGNFILEAFNTPKMVKAVWGALDASDKWHRRQCTLTAPLVLWTVVSMSLFRSVSIANVFKRVMDAARGTKDIAMGDLVTDEAVYHARGRLSWQPLELLAKNIVSARAKADKSFMGRRPYAFDGVTMDVPDTPENVIGFGRQVGSRGPAAFPQLKGVGLLDIGTRQFVDFICGSWNMSELLGAEMLLKNLGPGDVLFLDRRFTKVDFWFQCLGTGASMVHRLSASYIPRRGRRLGPGDWLLDVGRWVSLPLDKDSNKCNHKRRWESRPMRLIEYKVGEHEVVQLLTDLIDAEKYPARDIAIGYHLRWEIELSYDELKTHLHTVMHGTMHTPFRSKSPRGVIQELWAMLFVYNHIRGLMVEAGKARDVPHLDISFVDTVEVVRLALPRIQSCSRAQRRTLYRRMLQDIADCLIDRPRRKRWSPRVVKQKVGTFLAKRAQHHTIKRDFALELILVDSA